MATLPDLDTTRIGPIAFWNATNHGISDVDPTEVLSDANINSYTQYDNGVDGTYGRSRRHGSREFNFRVKSDGWFIAWLDRTNDTGTSLDESTAIGEYDFIDDWTYGNSNDSRDIRALPNSVGSQIISDLNNELSTSGTFNHSDVGYYYYTAEAATTMTFMAEAEVDGGNINGGLSYTSDATRHTHLMTAVYQHTSDHVNFDGNTVEQNSATCGVADILGRTLMPNSGTTYSQATGTGSTGYEALVTHFIIYE